MVNKTGVNAEGCKSNERHTDPNNIGMTGSIEN